MKLMVTCEHAGNEVPQEFEFYFKNAEKELHSHRGYDPGALDLFKTVSEKADFSAFQKLSRLVIEMNRSLNNPELFSNFTSAIPSEEKQILLEKYYYPYRNDIENFIASEVEKGEEVLHFSVHSFTPVLNGKIRTADIGLLFDPDRLREQQFCEAFRNKLIEKDNRLKIKFNYPYLGTADGFTTYLRKRFPQNYLGIELEVNQKYVVENKMNAPLKKVLHETLSEILSEEK